MNAETLPESVQLQQSSSFAVVKNLYNTIKELILIIKDCFKMSGSSSTSTGTKSAKDILAQLANILPTSTYMAFQVIAPLATNNGHCGLTEKIVTGVLLVVFAVIITFSCFTDSVKIGDKVYYGIVTSKGLWNWSFSGVISGADTNFYTGGTTKYKLRAWDFVNAFVSLIAFAALTLLADPIASCFFPRLSSTVYKAVPLIVGVLVSFIVSFAPAARNGVGYTISIHSVSSASTTASLLQHEEPADSRPAP